LNFSGAYSDDKELVRGLQEGESQAFRVLVEKYHVKVIRTCIGFVHSAADAEDIAQDVFIEIFRSVKNFRGDSELSTWLYRISVNKSLNFLRSASRRRIFTLLTGVGSAEKQGVSQDEITGADSTDDKLIREDQARALSQALDSLPGNQRTAFVLNKYEDMAYKEIAAVMDISMGSVESLIFRAKQNLQKRLYVFYQKNMK